MNSNFLQKDTKPMSVFGWLFVFISATFVVAANLLLRAGVDTIGGFVGNFPTVLADLIRLGKQSYFDLGGYFLYLRQYCLVQSPVH
jgi:hypothetical protein